MALSKRRLRWVLLIIIAVLPATITAALMYFVTSDTWSRQSAAAISKASGMQVALKSIALAGSNRHQLSQLVVADAEGQEHFQITTVAAEGFVFDSPQRIALGEEWTWTLHENSDIFLISLMQAALAQEIPTLFKLQKGRLGSLLATLEYNSAGILDIQLSGNLDQATSQALAKALGAVYYVEQIPAFIFAESTVIDQLHLSFNGKDLSWELQCHWQAGSFAAQYTDGLCRINEYHDQRLPGFSISAGAAQMAGLPFNQATLHFNQASQELSLALNGDILPAQLNVLPQANELQIRVASAMLPHSATPLASYFHGEIARQYVPDLWDLSGSTWQWSNEGPAHGQLQLQGQLPSTEGNSSVKVRGAWSWDKGLQCTQVLFHWPHISGITDLSFPEGLLLDNIQWMSGPPLFVGLWQALGAQQLMIQQAAQVKPAKPEVLQLAFLGPEAQVMAACQTDTKQLAQWKIPQANAEAVNLFAQRTLLSSGQMLGFEAALDADSIRLSGTLKDVLSPWPLADWRIAEGALSYRRGRATNSGKEHWSLEIANSTWQYDVAASEKIGNWKIHIPVFGWSCDLTLNAGERSLEFK